MNSPYFSRLCGALLLGLTLVSQPLLATTIRPPTFDQLVQSSGRVVRAEVLDVSPFEDSYEGKRIVRTQVKLNVLESLQGDVPTGELNIRYLGGEIGDLRMEVGAMPKFEVGKELVLFLHGSGNFICPTVGWGHGQYLVDRVAEGATARIRRANGELLTSLAQVAEPLHGARQVSHDPLSMRTDGVAGGISLAQFRELIREGIEQHTYQDK